MSSEQTAFDSSTYRSVMGQYPTGVCVVTADDPETGFAGMVIGSFTSVSLDPPLVAFFPTKTSTTWPKIERAGAFCVNVLSADQESVCRAFFGGSGDKFAGLDIWRSDTGSPVLRDSLAWIDCDIKSVQEAGDHWIVLGRVRGLGSEGAGLPLLFFQGGYGRFENASVAAADVHGRLAVSLRDVDLARPLMERFAEDFGCRVTASARVEDGSVILASAGHSREPGGHVTLVGQRSRFMPPMGSVFAAFGPPGEAEAWLDQSPNERTRQQNERSLSLVRSRGVSFQLYSPALRALSERQGSDSWSRPDRWEQVMAEMIPNLSYNPLQLDDDVMLAVRQIAAPVFNAQGTVAYAFAAYGFRPRTSIGSLIDALLDLASLATRRIGGRSPEERTEGS